MKKLLSVILSGILILSAGLIYGQVSDQEATFELLNKDDVMLKIPIFQITGGKLVAPNPQDFLGFKVNKGETARAQIQVTDPEKFEIKLGISYTNFILEYSLKPRPADKTVYVTFNPNKLPDLYPQTGPLWGIKGKTASGLSLKHNIGKEEIEFTKMKFY